MKKIGIFLGFAPVQPIKNQGIGRLMGFILKGILKKNDCEVIIACPLWYHTIVIDFLNDQKIDLNRVEILTTDSIPILIKLTNLLSKSYAAFKSGSFLDKVTNKIRYLPGIKNKALRGSKKVKREGLKIFDKVVTTSSVALFSLIALTLLLSLFILMPFVIALSILAISLMLFVTGTKIIRSPQFARPRSLMKKIIKKISPARQIKNILSNPISLIKNTSYVHYIYNQLRKAEFKKLNQKINAQPNIYCWFVPALFWPEIASIKGHKIVSAPDIVFLDFPSMFSNYNTQVTYQNIMKVIDAADHFVCYSDYVKQKHLIEPFQIEANKISVIKHGGIDLQQDLENRTTLDTKEFALSILNDYQNTHLSHSRYLCDFNFSDTRFIFYSSQIRPHKNFLSLVKAYEILLRKRFINVKLIVTANIYNDAIISDYITSRRLQYDIIALPNVPSKVLAALNHLAICAVNPTLFEGGFPFTFAEAYSVGTPSIMSMIPVVTAEIHDAELKEKMLFDPYNLQDMVNKMEWGILNHEKLYAMQKPLYDQLSQRSWEAVADEYITLLENYTPDAA